MENILISLFGKSVSTFSSKLNLGSGATWPGHIALKVNKNFIRQTIGENTKIVLVAGTNGKTTTSALIAQILEKSNFKIAHNKSGANQLNGISSIIIQDLPLFSSKLNIDYLILEVDENVLPLLLKHLTPDYIICLNLFRDQLDRYGEIDSIIKKWKDSFEKLTNKTTFILNADDPQVSYLGEKIKVRTFYFGLNENDQKTLEHGSDSIYCPNCLHSLDYKTIVFSHLGDWSCPNCGLKRQKLNIDSFGFYPMPGNYNKYNTLAAALFAREQKISDDKIDQALKSFKPAFGRQEQLTVDGKIIKIFLAKNPTSFNQSLETILELRAKNILIILNDRFVDGQDVSWIWDTNTSPLDKIPNITVSGDRTYDMALRIKYSDIKDFDPIENLDSATKNALNKTSPNETLFILPTYTAMLDVRKILKGRKIL